MAQDTGLVKRGLVLLAVIALVGMTVLFILFRDTPKPATTELKAAEPLIASIMVPIAGFPGSVNWASLYQLPDLLPSSPGWDVRYDATKVLALRGSPKLPLHIMREMLDEDRQLKNFRTQLKDGRIVPKVGDAQNVVLIALKAFHEWHKHPNAVAAARDNPELQRVYASVEKLTQHGNTNLKNEALKIRLLIKPQ